MWLSVICTIRQCLTSNMNWHITGMCFLCIGSCHILTYAAYFKTNGIISRFSTIRNIVIKDHFYNPSVSPMWTDLLQGWIFSVLFLVIFWHMLHISRQMSIDLQAMKTTTKAQSTCNLIAFRSRLHIFCIMGHEGLLFKVKLKQLSWNWRN